MKSRNVPSIHILIVVLGIACILILFPITTTSPASQLKSWTYPSGYDPHGGYVDQLTFIVYPYEEISQALLALQIGTVYSYDERIPYQSVPEIVGTPGIEVTSELGTSYRQFTLNCDRFPTNITGYRRALAYALDKYAVVENVRGGFAQVMDNPIPLPYDFWCYEDQMTTHYYGEDIVSANATLDAAHIIDTPDSPHPGWRYYDADRSGDWTEGIDKRGDQRAPDGLKTEIWIAQFYEPAVQAGQTLIDGMEKCGLFGQLYEPFDVFFPDFSIACLSWNINSPGDPTLLYDFFHVEGEDNSFFYQFNNSEYNYNCSKFMSAPTRLEARIWAWNCCRILMKEMPMIVCYNDENTHAYRTDIWEGYIPQIGINRMGGNTYTYQKIHLKESAGGPFGCFPTEYITVLSEGMDDTNTISRTLPNTQTILSLIYSTLWRVDPLDPFTGAAPDLAYNWSIQPTTASGDIQEGAKYTFNLYDNITWHDGTPFTSEDVQYSLMTIHPWGWYTADNVASIYRVDTPDDYTVEIYSNSTGYVDFTKATSVQILPKHIWAPYESTNFTWTPETPEEMTGTGCYKWITRVSGEYIVLERFKDWHFGVEHPERPFCTPSRTPLLYVLLAIFCIVIIIQVVILGYLLWRRSQHAKKKS